MGCKNQKNGMVVYERRYKNNYKKNKINKSNLIEDKNVFYLKDNFEIKK